MQCGAISIRRAQSAMEYLMTYGWAILIIAVVLAALFSLGVFNTANLGPRAQPGSCHVFRPGGPGTNTNVNLEGICNGELPEYVAGFNGQNASVNLNVTKIPIGASARTVVAWFYATAQPPSSNQDSIFAYGTANSCDQTFWVSVTSPSNTCDGGQIFIDNWCTCQAFPGFTSLTTRKWYFVADEYNGTNQIGYLGDGGNLVSVHTAVSINTGSSPFYIGYWTVRQYFNGSIANVQVYNSSLSSNEISLLYQEGVGGTPIDLQNLVGWWPLNGNAQDYSGNNNNGEATNVIFTSQWTGGYSVP